MEVDHGLGHVGEFASGCFGPMLAMGPVAASRKVETAAILASRLPLTLAAMSAGDLDPWRASIIATQLSEASAASCAAVEALLFPAVLSEAPGAVTKRVRRVLLDERTGVVIETGIDTYLPNPGMRRFIGKRDGTCRFPGCARNARRRESDHVIPYSWGAPTVIWNLASLCKHHHRVKHQAGWKLAMTRDGNCTCA
ncbi:MAG: HNH endonuclease signature motif containing protein [Dermatophilaceae bacterium]